MKERILIGCLCILPSIVNCQEFSQAVRQFIALDTTIFVIQNVKLIDGTDGPIQNNRDVLVEYGKISTIGSTNSFSIPRNAQVIDGTGKTLIPGLIMLHEHLFYTMPFEGQFDVSQMSHTFPRLYLAGGVTTMRTAGSVQPGTDIRIRDVINDGQMAGPHIDVTGPFINREAGNFVSMGEIRGAEEARDIVNFWADQGVTSFKVYQNIHKHDLKAVVENAHERNLKVTGHICSVSYSEAAEIGIDCLEHGFFMASDFIHEKRENICEPFERNRSLQNLDEGAPEFEELIDLLIENNVAVTSTLPVFEPSTDREVVPGGGLDALIPQVRERLLRRHALTVNKEGNYLDYFNKQMAWEKKFYDKGGLLVAGTDPTGAGRVVAGFANQHTIELLVEAGFTIKEAIKIATLHGAKYMGIDDKTGSVEKGKDADLVLIDGDLEDDISEIRNMWLVIKGGIGFDSKKLFESVEGKVGLN